MFATGTLAFALVAGVAFAAPEEERVTSLPEMGTFDKFGLFSGYVQIPETSKNLHYMFVESQNSPSTDPVLIWFNGGPGCSSMLGFIQEHGPFVINSDTDYIVENQWSWNKEANVLYLESPAGVGFSYCEGVKDCTFDDHKSGKDNLTAVLEWFKKFPEFGDNELYISGESYAGIYVPYLTYFMDQYITEHGSNPDVFTPNLKGFAVGNGVTNWNYDTTTAFLEMGYWHSLYDTELYDQFKENECDFGGPYMLRASEKCFELLDEFENLVSDVNIYDIFGICYGPAPHPALYESNGMPHKKHFTSKDYTPWASRPASSKKEGHRLQELPPCTFGNPLLDYLNLIEVRENLHIPQNIQAWDLCTSDIHYVIEPEGSQWIYEALQGKYRMLHYSGDIDGAVPSIGTQNWINTLGWESTESWRSYTVNNQVAGFLESFEGGLTFATVHGAGHMAPQFKRPETYHLIFNWINQRDI